MHGFALYNGCDLLLFYYFCTVKHNSNLVYMNVPML